MEFLIYLRCQSGPNSPHFLTALATILTCVVLMSVVLTAVYILVLVSSLAAFLAIRDRQRRHGLPYPPGPRPLPFIGNLLDIPKEFSWLSYTQLSKEHGMIHSSPI